MEQENKYEAFKDEIEFLDKSNVVKPVKLSIPDKSEI